jgi:hypothetical protein
VSVNVGKFKVEKRHWYVREISGSEEYWHCAEKCHGASRYIAELCVLSTAHIISY